MDDLKFTVKVINGLGDVNPENDNIDVEIELSDGRRFGGTFFTLSNIETLMKRWSKTGECLDGMYFYTTDCVVVKRLTQEIIEMTVKDMIENESFGSLIELKD